jgi:hypothetical protein
MSALGRRGFTWAPLVLDAVLLGASEAALRDRRPGAWTPYTGHVESEGDESVCGVRGSARFTPPRQWEFITSHARVLLLVAHDPQLRVEEIADAANVSNRSVYRILADLGEAGYLRRSRAGVRNRYELNQDLPLGDPVLDEQPVRDLLSLIEV